MAAEVMYAQAAFPLFAHQPYTQRRAVVRNKRAHVEPPSTVKRFRSAPEPSQLSALVAASTPSLPAFLPTRYTAANYYPADFHFGLRNTSAHAAPAPRLLENRAPPSYSSSSKVELLDDIDVDGAPVILKPLKGAAKALKQSGVLSIPRSLSTPMTGTLTTVDPRAQELKERLIALAKLAHQNGNNNVSAYDALPDAEEVVDEDEVTAPRFVQEVQGMEM